MTAGIETRHARSCGANAGAKCNCEPTHRPWVWSPRDKKKIRPEHPFPTEAAAKLWRSDAYGKVKRGTMRAPTAATLREAWEAWLRDAESGTIRLRNGQRYKPSTLRGYGQAMRLRVLPELGGRKLASVQSIDVQRLVDAMLGDDHDPSTIRNTVNSLRAVFRRACRPGGDVAVNPTFGLELPSVDSRRDRIAEPDEAVRLLAALPEEDRALWACACYAGLRLGELRALEYDAKEGLDLAGGVIHVRWGWDPVHGRIRPKSKAGVRDIRIAGVLRDYHVEHRARTGRERGLVFGRTETRPFNPTTVYARAERAWAETNAKLIAEGREPLVSIRPHELRHTAVSTWIAAGIEAKQISVWAGHHSVSFTYDRYGHLFQRRGEFEMAKLDAFLELANTEARLEQLERGPGAGQSGQLSSGL